MGQLGRTRGRTGVTKDFCHRFDRGVAADQMVDSGGYAAHDGHIVVLDRDRNQAGARQLSAQSTNERFLPGHTGIQHHRARPAAGQTIE